MRALYDCSRYLTSFNFYEWLLLAKARGATTVVFDIRNMRGDKWPLSIAHKRFNSILLPGPALAGLSCEVFDGFNTHPTRARDIAKPGGGPLVAFCRAGNTIPRLRSVWPAKKVKYTVTLRNTQRAPLRNSDEKVWRDFAAEIGALVIPDFEDKPMLMFERMALYAGARMNFFVSNGPALLCTFTEYPCMLFNTVHARGSLLADGMQDGEQYPWLLPNQRAIWEEATPESLRRHFNHWNTTGEFAHDEYIPTPEA